MRTSMGRYVKRFFAVLGTLVVLLVLAVVILNYSDWNRYRSFVDRMAKKSTGRDLVIAGDLRGNFLTGTPWVEAEKLRFANAPWGERPSLFTADRVYAKIRLLPLLHGRIDFVDVQADQPDLLLEKNAKGDGNWALELPAAKKAKPVKTAEEKASALPLVESAKIEGARFAYVDHDTGKRTEGRLASFATHETAPDQPTTFEGSGSFDRLPFDLSGSLGSEKQLTSGEAFPFSLRARSQENSLHVSGRVDDPTSFKSVTAAVRFSSRHLDELLGHFGLKLSGEVPPVRVAGQIKATTKGAEVNHLDAHLGGSRLQGSASIELRDPRPYIVANLVVPALRTTDLKAFLPQKVKQETPAARKQQAKAEGEVKPLFSPAVIPVAVFKKLDADVKLALRHLEGEGAVALLDSLDTQVRLKGGRLDVSPLDARIAGGKVTLDLHLDASKEPLFVDVKTGLQRVEIQSLLAPFVDKPGKTPQKVATKLAKEPASDLVQGRIGGSVHLAAAGPSLHELARTLTGQIGLAIEDGRVSALISDALPLDLTSFVAAFAQRKKDATLQCTVARVAFDKGVGKVQTLLVATPDANIVGGGTVDLGQESLDLKIRSYPKDWGLLSVRAPVDLTGPFSHPKVKVEKGPLVAEGVAAVALGAALGPAAALVPLIQPGLGDKGACAKYSAEIARIQERGRTVAH